jgi:septal ring factor EnvC (AmiA/AmiB activator)
MSITKEINKKLDEILSIRAEINRMKKELNNNESLTNKLTGEKCTKQDALDIVENVIDDIKKDLNKITNNGKNVKDIFTNNYYVNDSMEDKRIAQNNNNKFLNN